MTEPEDGVDVTAQCQLEDSRRTTELLLRARDGDLAAGDEYLAALDKILRRYGELVNMIVGSFRLQEADRYDAIQMTWLRLAEYADRVQFPERLGGWLVTTARRECIHILRQAKRGPSLTDKTPEFAADPAEGPEQRAIDAEIARILHALVEELPPLQQILIKTQFTDDPPSYAETAQITEIPLGAIGPTRARALRQLRLGLGEFGARGVEGVEGKLTEGDRTGSHFLDNLLDKADQALREKLEPKVTDLRTSSTQGTGDSQLDDLLLRADAALRVTLRDHQATVSGFLSAEEKNLDDLVVLLPADRLQKETRPQLDTVAHKVGDTADALLGFVEEFLESEPSDLDEARRPTRSGRIQAAGRPPAVPTTPPPSGDRAPLLSRTAWSAAARVGVGLGTVGVSVFVGHSFGAGTTQVLSAALLLICLGMLLEATWTIQPKLRRQNEERRRLNEEWSAVRTARRQRNQCRRCASPLSEQDWYFAPKLAEDPPEDD